MAVTDSIFGTFGGIWLALIGVMINGAARGASMQTRMNRQIGTISVADVMDREPVDDPRRPLDRAGARPVLPPLPLALVPGRRRRPPLPRPAEPRRRRRGPRGLPRRLHRQRSRRRRPRPLHPRRHPARLAALEPEPAPPRRADGGRRRRPPLRRDHGRAGRPRPARRDRAPRRGRARSVERPGSEPRSAAGKESVPARRLGRWSALFAAALAAGAVLTGDRRAC